MTLKNIDLLLESIDLNKSIKMDAKQIKDAYLANVLASLILVLSNDHSAKKSLNDITHKTLKVMSPGMSLVNYWGCLVFNSKDRSVTKHLNSKVADELHKVAGRVLWSAVQPIHDAIATMKIIDLDKISEGLRIITLRLPCRTPRSTRIREAIASWYDLDANDRNAAINESLMYLLEADLHSPLTSNLKTLSAKDLLQATPKKSTPTLSVNNMAKMFEDDMAAVGAVDIAPVTSSASIATVPMRLFPGKSILKRTRRKWKQKANK